MAFELPALPYGRDALSPHISAETIDFHYGKHHQAYVTKLNELIAGTAHAHQELEDVVRTSQGPVFNNAAQVWNHTFYWHSMSPAGGGEPRGDIKASIDASFGSFSNFKDLFSKAALGQFGSGWAWLVKEDSGKLAIVTTANAATPITQAHAPVLTCDVWEHAYYIDYRNARANYINAWWNLVNWDFASQNIR
jgi:Fe-Mn family superoxide dismutase